LRDHEKAIGYSLWNWRELPERRLVEEHVELEAKHREMKRVHEELRQLHQDVTAEIRELLRTVLSGALVQEWGSVEPE
jgi:seryl-tRNA synthetase